MSNEYKSGKLGWKTSPEIPGDVEPRSLTPYCIPKFSVCVTLAFSVSATLLSAWLVEIGAPGGETTVVVFDEFLVTVLGETPGVTVRQIANSVIHR